MVIVAEEVTATDDSDFRTELIKIKNANPDVVLFGVTSKKANFALLKQRSEIYPDSTLYSTESFGSFVGQEEFQELLDDVHIISPEGVSPEFIEKYKERFGTEPIFSASNTYDATNMIIEATKAVGTDASKLREYLYNTEFDTVTFGAARFNSIGGVQGAKFMINQVK